MDGHLISGVVRFGEGGCRYTAQCLSVSLQVLSSRSLPWTLANTSRCPFQFHNLPYYLTDVKIHRQNVVETPWMVNTCNTR